MKHAPCADLIDPETYAQLSGAGLDVASPVVAATIIQATTNKVLTAIVTPHTLEQFHPFVGSDTVQRWWAATPGYLRLLPTVSALDSWFCRKFRRREKRLYRVLRPSHWPRSPRFELDWCRRRDTDPDLRRASGRGRTLCKFPDRAGYPARRPRRMYAAAHS